MFVRTYDGHRNWREVHTTKHLLHDDECKVERAKVRKMISSLQPETESVYVQQSSSVPFIDFMRVPLNCRLLKLT